MRRTLRALLGSGPCMHTELCTPVMQSRRDRGENTPNRRPRRTLSGDMSRIAQKDPQQEARKVTLDK